MKKKNKIMTIIINKRENGEIEILYLIRWWWWWWWI